MFDIIVRLIMGFALIWMGLNLFLRPRAYKAFAENLKGPSFTRLFVNFPDWLIQTLGKLRPTGALASHSLVCFRSVASRSRSALRLS
jgi:hypothetical protein